MAGAEAQDPFSEVWGNYRLAIQDLYGAELETIAAPGEPVSPAPQEPLLEAALIASTNLTVALTGEAQSTAVDGYEATVLRLFAVATIDLAIADDLARPTLNDSDVAGEPRIGSALSAVLGDALTALEPPTGDPFDRRIIAGGQELELPDAKVNLRASFDAATQGIISDASSASVSTVSIVLGATAERLHEIVPFNFAGLVEELQHLPHVPKRVRWAASFLRQGLGKIRATLAGVGEGAFKEVREWVSGQIEKLASNRLEDWLAKTYGVQAMTADLRERIRNAAAEPRSLVAAAGELDRLAARFHSQMTFARRAAWLIGRARKWLFHVHPPLSEIAVIAGAATATGAVIWLGDDYLDAPRQGWTSNLRVIRGVDLITREAL